MTIAVVIPAYNAAATLGLCLEACLAQTFPPAEIIVVDDGSTDDTAAVAESHGVRCLRGARAGPAAARNKGAQATAADIVAFTDADCIPERDWVEKLLAGFKEGVAGVGGSYGNANAQNILSRLVHEEIRGRHEKMRHDADFLGSFNVAYRRDVFLAAGGFDEAFRHASGEDNDLAYRIHDAGYRLVFLPECRVAHHHPTQLLPYLRTQMRHGFWRMKLYAKHAGRSGGDQYAGLADLAAPPLCLAVAALWATALVCYVLQAPYAGWIAGCALAATVLYGIVRIVLPMQLVRRTGRIEMAWFLPLAVLRDFARGLGLIRGIWWFHLRRKTTL